MEWKEVERRRKKTNQRRGGFTKLQIASRVICGFVRGALQKDILGLKNLIIRGLAQRLKPLFQPTGALFIWCSFFSNCSPRGTSGLGLAGISG
ncbi:hypothetical protein E5K00_04500 [Hymenobacter aquaticus]|uniref:Uncharacterized protein n=1 Tax=Hymenobacter aquaticus TaxID=1867101 RepID=A0A4Z0Q5Y1_9BACT|nr:hypothetical protein [Hymenobacter aquaticus]TGE24481.1 hypothetical protein E5K00_04500 [Hymenobacter aquaticus]